MSGPLLVGAPPPVFSRIDGGGALWCVFELVPKTNGRPDKQPRTRDGRSCRWGESPDGFLGTYAESRKAAEALNGSTNSERYGVGFVLTDGVTVNGRRLVAIDVDACIDDAKSAAWLVEFLATVPETYVEFTPSGTGLRVWLLFDELPAFLAEKHRKYRVRGAAKVKGKVAELEPFGVDKGKGRFVTFTGNRAACSGDDVAAVVNSRRMLEWLKANCTMSESVEGKLAPDSHEPIDLEAIRRNVCKLPEPWQTAIVDGDWEPVAGQDESSSEVFFQVVRKLLDAAQGHRAAVVEFILDRTDWPFVESESEGIGKYGRRARIEKEVERVARKTSNKAKAAEAFESVAMPASWTAPAEDTPGAAAPGMPTTAADVFADWRERGPLEHEPTGLPWLDARTGGGLPYGTRAYVVGAPDAGKTVLLVQIADEYLRRGIPVGFLAVDEEPEDVLLRFMQRRGAKRAEVERVAWSPEVEHDVRNLPLRLYGPAWTIEAAGADLATLGRGALLVDSLQTCRSAAELGAQSLREAVTARTKAIRKVAAEFGHITVTTSEMGRAHYVNREHADKLDALGAGKESGAIEYSARILVALRSEGDDVVHVETPKNKLGTRAGETFLRLDKARQTLTTAEGYVPPSPDARKAERAQRQTIADAAVAARVLAAAPVGGLTVRKVRAGCRKLAGMSQARVDDALECLDGAAVERTGARNAKLRWLDGARVAPEVLEMVPGEERETVQNARPV